MVKRTSFKIIAVIILLFSNLLLADQGGNDQYGYMWTDNKSPNATVNYDWIDARTGTAIFGAAKDDELSSAISLGSGFDFSYYGANFNSIYVSTNGYISFNGDGDQPVNQSIPFTNGPDSILAVYWDDLVGSSTGNVYYTTIGTSPHRKFVVQWDFFRHKNLFPFYYMTFEAILYETSNLIKFQYNFTQGDSLDGSEATVGINFENDGLEYSYNQTGAVTDGMAILFHPRNIGSDAAAKILPAQAIAGTNFKEFNYRLFDINKDSLKQLGRVDYLKIDNPFNSTTPVITALYLDGDTSPIPLMNSTSPPTDPGVATWHYDSGSDFLELWTTEFAVRDSMRIRFVQNMPTSASLIGDYSSEFDARIGLTSGPFAATDSGWTLGIDNSTPHHFVKGAGVSDPITVNTVRSLSLTLYDEFNNTISDSVVTFTRVTGNGTFTASGTATTDVTSNASGVVSADLHTASTLTSYGSDVIEVTIGDVVSTITIPLQAAAIDTFVFAPSGGRDLVAGKWLQYIVTAKDAQGNNVTSNQSVTLSATSANADHFPDQRVWLSITAIP